MFSEEVEPATVDGTQELEALCDPDRHGDIVNESDV